MKISASKNPLSEQHCDAIILFFREESLLLPSGDDRLRGWVSEQLPTSSFKGKAGQVAVLPSSGTIPAKRIILSGTGSKKQFHAGILEQAAAAAIRAGSDAGARTFAMASSIALEEIDDDAYQLLAGRGAAWGSYAFSAFKSDKTSSASLSLVFSNHSGSRAAIKTAEEQGRALIETADLANLPGNEAPPERIASWARSMARRNGLECEILGKAELKRKGCGGILAVAQGSAQDARMIILRHAGSNPKAQPIVLVGKTVTFDSGGISLKPGKGMGWMRYDKSGGMAVLAAMQMASRMKIKAPVVAILGAAENMPGANAVRPGDIIKAFNGKTIEVLNTDAEGRLVLADALGLAAEMKPRAIVDIATLTGAAIVALGYCASAILGNDDTLLKELIDSGAQSGERHWQLPLYPEYTEEMQSDFADLSNLSKSGMAGTATAAAFLQEFVPEGIPWAHLDIAGPAWLESPKPYQAPGATLFGARTLTHWIARQ